MEEIKIVNSITFLQHLKCGLLNKHFKYIFGITFYLMLLMSILGLFLGSDELFYTPLSIAIASIIALFIAPFWFYKEFKKNKHLYKDREYIFCKEGFREPQINPKEPDKIIINWNEDVFKIKEFNQVYWIILDKWEFTIIVLDKNALNPMIYSNLKDSYFLLKN